ncbi:MAG: hypothetical protein J7L52_09095 [Thermotogae bacterium]|nr:hypothetical protein [Thermotogota bacterium]
MFEITERDEHISGVVIIVPKHRIISIGVLKGIIRRLSLLKNLPEEKLIAELK